MRRARFEQSGAAEAELQKAPRRRWGRLDGENMFAKQKRPLGCAYWHMLSMQLVPKQHQSSSTLESQAAPGILQVVPIKQEP